MDIIYPEIGICGLSCRLCPRYQTEAASKCGGCKSPDRMAAGCPFITCAIKKMGVEFCGDCKTSESCGKWRSHRAVGRGHDSFKSYQKLEDDIRFIQAEGMKVFDGQQRLREALLRRLLNGYNEGRSKNYYSIAATVMEIPELEGALEEATTGAVTMSIKDKSRMMHARLDAVALKKGYRLNLRK